MTPEEKGRREYERVTGEPLLMPWTPGTWKFGMRPDTSMWMSLGDPKKGPHYQGDFVGTVADARLMTNARELYEALEALWRDNQIPAADGHYERATAALDKAFPGRRK